MKDKDQDKEKGQYPSSDDPDTPQLGGHISIVGGRLLSLGAGGFWPGGYWWPRGSLACRGGRLGWGSFFASFSLAPGGIPGGRCFRHIFSPLISDKEFVAIIL